MDKLVNATEKLMRAVKELHPQFYMGDLKQEACYLAYHECREALLEKHNDPCAHPPVGVVTSKEGAKFCTTCNQFI
jgi:hypothetical protein